MKPTTASHTVTALLINTLRFVLAGVFIFSGFVKAVDPMGTAYKLADYAEAFGLTGAVQPGLFVTGSMLLCLFEFVLGIWLLFAIWRRTALTATLVFLCLMTPLTLYLAIANPVSDCGCFGDAVHLTNWQTFAKNLILLACLIPVFIYNKRLVRLIHPNSQWIVTFFAIVSLFLFMRMNLRHLPAFDFRPWHVGTNIEEAMAIPDDAAQPVYETLFTLSKDGQEREFTLDNYPDSTWTFVSSHTVLQQKGYEAPIHDFTLLNDEGDDVTDQLFAPGWNFLLVMNELRGEDMLDVINDLYDHAEAEGYGFYALTSATDDDIDRWRHNTGADYPFYQLDDITLKTIVRSNPGLLLIHDGVITGKWSRHDIPGDKLCSAPLDELEAVTHTRSNRRRRHFDSIFWMFVPYPFLGSVDKLLRRWRAKRKKTLSDSPSKGEDANPLKNPPTSELVS